MANNIIKLTVGLFLLCLGLLPFGARAIGPIDPIALKTIQVTSERITFVFKPYSPFATYKLFTLPNPERLVIDFKHVRLAASLKNIDLSHSTISDIRSGYPKPGILRLVFDTNAKARYTVVSASPNLILAIQPSDQPNDLPPKAKKSPTASLTDFVITPEGTVQEIKPKTTFVVVIDPGHGGKDPGAVGESGTKEKDVVLAISQQLAALINHEPNMRAVLTRNGDYFVPLRNRLKLARKGDADLFIAVHADSYFAHDASSGASVYALSERGATSEAARWLAQKDNYSELGGVNLTGLGDQSYLLRSVLIDLAQTATITDSLRLGTSILQSLSSMTKLHYKKVEQAPFVVLKSPDIPSVLVETGFLSNSNEEFKLRDARYQKKMAEALLSGIQNYAKNYRS